jgi:hypothetical protein
VLCAAGDDDHGHVHGDCNLSSFKLALVHSGEGSTRAFACLYKSKPGVWGNVISTAIPTDGWIHSNRPGVLVGNTSCWLLSGVPTGDILQFDFDMLKLDVVEKPVYRSSSFHIMQTQDRSLGLIALTGPSMHFWERKVNSARRWVLKKTIESDKHLSPRQPIKHMWTLIRGYEEGNNVIFLRTSINFYIMIQLDSIRYKEIPRSKFSTTYFPYSSFYAAGNGLSLHCKSNYSTFTLSFRVEFLICILVNLFKIFCM